MRRRACVVALALAASAPPARGEAAARYGYSAEFGTLLELSLFQSLGEHTTNSAILAGAFDTTWLYNGTLVLEDVRALLYTELLASSSDVYFIYSGFTNGAFVGYYNEGVVLAAGGGRAVGWIDDENSTCPDWGVDEQCRAYFAIDPVTGRKRDQLSAMAYDPRERGWYKTLVALQGAGTTAVSSWSSIFRDSTLSATQSHPPGNSTSPSTDHSMALCSSLLSAAGAFQGVGCTALLLDVLDRAFRGVLDDYDEDDVLAYVRERDTGRVVVSSVPNATQLWDPTYVGSKPPALFYDGVDHPVSLINRSVAYLDALDLWTNDTVVHDDGAGFFYETIRITDDYLDWTLVVVQAVRCPAACYTVLEGALFGSCQACADGATALEGAATSCDLCVAGTYRDDETGLCVDCPSTGFTCETTDVTLKALPLEAGYMRMHDRSTEALACVGGDEACPGGSLVGCGEADYEPDGPYCAVCTAGSYLDDRGHCHACGRSLGVRTAVGIAVASVALFFLGRYLSSLGESAAATKRAVATGRLMNKLKSKWRIMFVAFQIVYSQPALLPDVSLPPVLERQYDALDVVSLDFGVLFPFRCSGGNYYTSLLFATLAPILFVVAVSGATAARACVASSRVSYRAVKVATATVGVLVPYVVLPAVTTETLAIYDCEALDSPHGHGSTPYLRRDYSVRCEGWTYACYRAYATMMIFVWPFGVPLAYFVLLYRRRRDIDPAVRVAPSDAARRRASMTRSAAGDVHRRAGKG